MKKICLLSMMAFALFACTKSELRQPQTSENVLEIGAAKNPEKIGGRPLWAQLEGENEVPVMGDPDGTGMAYITLNHGQGSISYELMVENIAPATAAHIHVGVAGVAGSVAIGLTAPTSGYSSGTIMNVDRALIKAMIQNPGSYYVNVHNAEYPGGAVRGQLSK